MKKTILFPLLTSLTLTLLTGLAQAYKTTSIYYEIKNPAQLNLHFNKFDLINGEELVINKKFSSKTKPSSVVVKHTVSDDPYASADTIELIVYKKNNTYTTGTLSQNGDGSYSVDEDGGTLLFNKEQRTLELPTGVRLMEPQSSGSSSTDIEDMSYIVLNNKSKKALPLVGGSRFEINTEE